MAELADAREELFAKNYIVAGDAYKAALDAGYAKSTAKDASKWINSPIKPNGKVNKKYKERVKNRIKELMDEKNDELIAKADEVLKYLTAVMRREEVENVVVTVSESNEQWLPDENGTMRKRKIVSERPQIIEIPTKVADANKAAELLGKRYCLFTDNVNLAGVLPVIISGEDNIAE
ncbi:MAG: terminase small subunit [Selenomonadales bacterium]|nr:terminase small subunit [Selenomonadales bacterium]